MTLRIYYHHNDIDKKRKNLTILFNILEDLELKWYSKMNVTSNLLKANKKEKERFEECLNLDKYIYIYPQKYITKSAIECEAIITFDMNTINTKELISSIKDFLKIK